MAREGRLGLGHGLLSGKGVRLGKFASATAARSQLIKTIKSIIIIKFIKIDLLPLVNGRQGDDIVRRRRAGRPTPGQRWKGMDKEILTTAEAAKILGVSVRTAQLLIEGGSIPSWKTPGGHRRVYRRDVLGVISGPGQTPMFASARVIVIARAERIADYEAVLAEVKYCVVESYTDIYAALLAIGSRLPAAVVIEAEQSGASGLAPAGEPALRSGARTHPNPRRLPSGGSKAPDRRGRSRYRDDAVHRRIARVAGGDQSRHSGRRRAPRSVRRRRPRFPFRTMRASGCSRSNAPAWWTRRRRMLSIA